MMKLMLVRHAESEGNATGDYSTASADSLSSPGVAQADALAARLQAWDFQHVVVSPLLRTLQTIAPYLRAVNRKAEIWPELAEACWHDEREPVSDSWEWQEASLPVDLDPLFEYRDGNAIRPAHPETFGQGLRRVIEAVERIRDVARRESGTILMVVHGHIIREMLNLLVNPPEYDDFHHDNCGATLISLNGTCEIVFCNRQI